VAGRTFTASVTSSDPVYVYGTRLRLKEFGRTYFVRNSLYRPPPVNHRNTRFSGLWTLLDPLLTKRESYEAPRSRKVLEHLRSPSFGAHPLDHRDLRRHSGC
jgi:hypothetical protein